MTSDLEVRYVFIMALKMRYQHQIKIVYLLWRVINSTFHNLFLKSNFNPLEASVKYFWGVNKNRVFNWNHMKIKLMGRFLIASHIYKTI